MDGVGYDYYVQNRCCNITNCCESPVKREKRTKSQTHNTDMSNQGYLMVRFATDCWPVHIQVDIWVIYINRGQALLIFYIWQASPVAGNKASSCAEDFSPGLPKRNCNYQASMLTWSRWALPDLYTSWLITIALKLTFLFFFFFQKPNTFQEYKWIN